MVTSSTRARPFLLTLTPSPPTRPGHGQGGAPQNMEAPKPAEDSAKAMDYRSIKGSGTRPRSPVLPIVLLFPSHSRTTPDEIPWLPESRGQPRRSGTMSRPRVTRLVCTKTRTIMRTKGFTRSRGSRTRSAYWIATSSECTLGPISHSCVAESAADSPSFYLGLWKG